VSVKPEKHHEIFEIIMISYYCSIVINYGPISYVEALEHKGSISKNQNFSGNDKNRIASFGG